MGVNKETLLRDASGIAEADRGIAHRIPDWLFHHQCLLESIDTSHRVAQSKVINSLNHAHFTGAPAYVYLKHRLYGDGIIVATRPDPCAGERVTCRWVDREASSLSLDQYTFEHLVIIGEGAPVIIPGELEALNGTSLTLKLPDISYTIEHRRTMRHACGGIKAHILQRGFSASGSLVDFSAASFRVRLELEGMLPLTWFNRDTPATVSLTKGDRMLFAGPCDCTRQSTDGMDPELVFSPAEQSITRFGNKTIRNPRREIEPKVQAVFIHPFFKKQYTLGIGDLSNSGFSVLERAADSVLAVGLIIPRLSLNFSGAFTVHCMAQVIYRREIEEGKFRCGLAILDMDLHDFSTLNQILNYSQDSGSFVSNTVDMDALWEFFFDTGFIYPQKYRHIFSNIADFKETYRKLYQEHPEIARHFTYEKEGKIHAHLSMVRAFERTWLVHHHAARHSESRIAGFHVLKHAILFAAGISRLASGTMDYVMSYYRPENRFPDRLFGGFARQAESPGIASLDLFAYLAIPGNIATPELPGDCTVHEMTPLEIWEFERFYNHHSGGLLADVFDFGGRHYRGRESLEDVSRRFGFLRSWKAYSLLRKGALVAVFVVNRSTFGINLSHLLNNIMVLVMDEELPPGVLLYSVVKTLSGTLDLDKTPLLLYPSEYAVHHNIACEKFYQLWILDVKRHIYDFMEYTRNRFRMRYK